MIPTNKVLVNKAIIERNTAIMREHLNEGTQIIAVIKANGYGADLIKAAYLCEQKLDIDYVAVSTVEEAIALRTHRVQLPIIILGPTLPENYHYLVTHDLIQAIVGWDAAISMSDYGLQHHSPIKTHLKIDTGLKRIGLSDFEEIKDVFALPGLVVKGIYTHFTHAQSVDEGDIDFSMKQVRMFVKILEGLTKANIDYGLTHVQNSPSILSFGDLGFDAVRCGMILFGLFHPTQQALAKGLGYRSAFALTSKVCLIKTVKANEGIGYGRTYIPDHDIQVATIATGYVEGVMRNLAKNKGNVVINDQLCPVIGDISMSLFMVDVTDVECQVEDDVWIFGHDLISIYDYISYTEQTINELVSHLDASLHREYLD